MKESMSFFSQNTWFIIAVIAVACVLLGRIWSNILNWGEITDPQLILKKGEHYKVINLYLPKGWTEGWEVGSIICFESQHKRFFFKKRKEIYVSGDRIRFSDEGPGIGSFYQAIFSNSAAGSILMKEVKKPVK
jgi:hypothetical protein